MPRVPHAFVLVNAADRSTPDPEDAVGDVSIRRRRLRVPGGTGPAERGARRYRVGGAAHPTRGSALLAIALIAMFCVPCASADVADDVRAATTAGHPVFLLVTEAKSKGIELARRVSEDAAKIVDAVVIELDRTAASSAPVVKRYRLESVQVPLILVIASNGVAAAATKPGAVTAGQLAKMVPSPAKAAYLGALDQKSAVLLVFATEKTPGRVAAVEACDAAVKRLEGKAVTIVVDLVADREAGFRREMSIDADVAAAVTIVVNARGQRTATFDSTPDPASLVDATKKLVEECCPGGRCK